MRGRIARAAVVAAMVGVLFAVQGAQLSGADDNDPIGYTVGEHFLPEGTLGATCNFYKIDLKTGAATQVNPVGQPVICADGLTYDEDGTIYAYRNAPTAGGAGGISQLITIDKHNGVQHVVGTLPHVFVGSGGMTFDADGDLWLYAESSGVPECVGTCLWEVNPKTAAARFVGTAPTAVNVLGLAGDCEDVLAITQQFGVAPNDGVVPDAPAPSSQALDELNTQNAVLDKIADVAIPHPTGLDFDAENDLWALGFTTTGSTRMVLYRVDPRNGNTGPTDITLNGAPFTGVMDGLAVSPIGDCEPETTTTAPPAPVVAAEPVFTG